MLHGLYPWFQRAKVRILSQKTTFYVKFFNFFWVVCLIMPIFGASNDDFTQGMTMKENRNSHGGPEKDILFSRAIKAGKRIYYVDVKQSSRGDMYLSLTESKKIVSGDIDMPQINFEKHKIFIYPEDFEKFTNGLTDAMKFIYDQQGPVPPRPEDATPSIQLDEMEF